MDGIKVKLVLSDTVLKKEPVRIFPVSSNAYFFNSWEKLFALISFWTIATVLLQSIRNNKPKRRCL